MLLFWKGNVTVTSSLTYRPYLQYGYTDGLPAIRYNALGVCVNASWCVLNANASTFMFKHSEEYLNGS